MADENILRELLQLFVRKEIPALIRSAIVREFGEGHYYPAREALFAGLADSEAVVREECIKALANDWTLQEVGPRLVEILENDDYGFVRMTAACGLGSIRYREALPVLKRAILDDKEHESLREIAYEAVLSILGKEEDDILETGVDQPTVIDWDLVRSL